jgi:hypothetical protein
MFSSTIHKMLLIGQFFFFRNGRKETAQCKPMVTFLFMSHVTMAQIWHTTTQPLNCVIT